MRPSWPIEVQALGAAAAGTVLWRHAGRSTLTVVVKASFSIEEGMAKLVAPADLVTEERLQPQTRSLVCDSDIAPYKPRAEVTFVGSACPPSPAAQIATRLAVSGSSPLFDRTLVVSGDRAAATAAPSVFRSMPIVWDRAWADPMQNPIGVQRGSGRAANIVDPSDESAPASFGPISRSWGARARFLGRGDPRRTEGTRPEMPAELSWGLFLSAPVEQQVSRLQGDEAFLLENLIEGRPRVCTQLPSPRAVARYHGPKAPRDGAPIAMRLDTAILNGYDRTIHLVWRGTMAFPDESVAAASRVTAGLEMTGLESPFGATPRRAESASPATVRMTTKGLGPMLPGGAPQAAPARASETERPFPKDSGTMPVGRQLFNVPKINDDPPLYDIDDPESSAGSTMAIDPEAAMKMLAGAKATPWDPNRPPPPPAPPPPAPPPPAPATVPVPPPPVQVPKTAPAPAGPPYPVASPGFPPPVVVRPAGADDIDDDDSVGSTMAITPEAAAELMARRSPAGAPPPPAPPAPIPHPPSPSPAGLVSPQRTPARTRPPTVPLPAPPPPMPPPPVAPAAFRPPAVTPDGRHGTLEMEPVPDSEAGGGTMVLSVPDDIAKRR